VGAKLLRASALGKLVAIVVALPLGVAFIAAGYVFLWKVIVPRAKPDERAGMRAYFAAVAVLLILAGLSTYVGRGAALGAIRLLHLEGAQVASAAFPVRAR